MTHSKDSPIPPLWIVSSAAVVGLVWLATQLRELVALLVVGYFLAYAIDPVLSRFESKGISRTVGFFLCCVAIVAVFALVGLTTVPTLVEEYERLSANLHNYVEVGKTKLGPLWQRIIESLPEEMRGDETLSDSLAHLPLALSDLNGEAVKRVFTAVGNTLLSGYNRALTFVNIALLPFIVFYIAVDMPKIHGSVATLVPLTRRKRFTEVVGEIDRYVSAFVRGQFIVCSALFVLYAIGLGCVGVDLWLLLAAISGFGNIVPYVGFLTGIVLSSLMALVTFGDFTHVLWVWLVYAVVQALEGLVISPRILGGSVGLSPLVIILALFAGGQLFGLLGIFLAVPAAAALRVVARSSYEWMVHR